MLKSDNGEVSGNIGSDGGIACSYDSGENDDSGAETVKFVTDLLAFDVHFFCKHLLYLSSTFQLRNNLESAREAKF